MSTNQFDANFIAPFMRVFGEPVTFHFENEDFATVAIVERENTSEQHGTMRFSADSVVLTLKNTDIAEKTIERLQTVTVRELDYQINEIQDNFDGSTNITVRRV